MIDLQPNKVIIYCCCRVSAQCTVTMVTDRSAYSWCQRLASRWVWFSRLSAGSSVGTSELKKGSASNSSRDGRSAPPSPKLIGSDSWRGVAVYCTNCFPASTRERAWCHYDSNNTTIIQHHLTVNYQCYLHCLLELLQTATNGKKCFIIDIEQQQQDSHDWSYLKAGSLKIKL